jgi:UDP-glucose 4-epimerase
MNGSNRVLVTGGAGFIGTHLCRKLSEAGQKVLSLDLRKPENPVESVEYVQGDVRDLPLLERILGRADSVVHLAATVSVPLCQKAPDESYSNNFGATLMLLEAIRKQTARRIGVIFAGTAAVYGDLGNDGRALKEPEVAPHFSSFYAAQKHASEKAIELYSTYHNIPATIFRFFNVFGPGQDPTSPYSGVITVLSKLAREGRPLPMNGGGGQTRDFISVHDIVAGVAAMAALPFDRWKAEPVNLGTGKSITVREVGAMISKVYGGKSQLVDAPPREGDVLHSRADIARARSLLAFSPRVSLEDGLRQLLNPASR